MIKFTASCRAMMARCARGGRARAAASGAPSSAATAAPPSFAAMGALRRPGRCARAWRPTSAAAGCWRARGRRCWRWRSSGHPGRRWMRTWRRLWVKPGASCTPPAPCTLSCHTWTSALTRFKAPYTLMRVGQERARGAYPGSLRATELEQPVSQTCQPDLGQPLMTQAAALAGPLQCQ